MASYMDELILDSEVMAFIGKNIAECANNFFNNFHESLQGSFVQERSRVRKDNAI